ncbi:hypothetical protein ACRE_057980 [Hapsidospora chrysogenum ATCC 11550]|uniref:2EXR domain-containing protein n=1 Tax=Hapsidospora chrysogenum (strain ATCC 11550 / CBS 779.69 / DSM 880 / IAM 14645 / JCM 23072 / IMI 49137) TaxID=857340 RepID=A0A086T275_HAPC1|nr:hypothetical protein ACRE_057980 [Hapsidospora chrysogenum ATCC 11550]
MTAAAAAAAAADFPRFSELPAEIRRMIWRETLDAHADAPMALPYHPFQAFRKPPPGSSSSNNPYPPLTVRIPTPVALYVSREARDVAKAFLRERGAEMYAPLRALGEAGTDGEGGKDGKDKKRTMAGEPMARRPVDWAAGDVLYVPRGYRRALESATLQIRNAGISSSGDDDEFDDSEDGDMSDFEEDFDEDDEDMDEEEEEEEEDARAMGLSIENAGGGLGHNPAESDTDSELEDERAERECKAEVLSQVRFLAVPAFTAYYNTPWLVFTLEGMPKVEKVFVVWGELPFIGAREVEGGVLGVDDERECVRFEVIPENDEEWTWEKGGKRGKTEKDGELEEKEKAGDNAKTEEEDGKKMEDEEPEKKKTKDEADKQGEEDEEDEEDEDDDEGTGPLVSMWFEDSNSGRMAQEVGRLGMWMTEMSNVFAITEMEPSVADRFFEKEDSFVPVRIVRWKDGEWRHGDA